MSLIDARVIPKGSIFYSTWATMPTHLNLLLLEDSVNDAELMLDVLREAGFELASRRVESKVDYLHALGQPPDFILSDFSMPQFTARDALHLLQERGLDIPFIVVSAASGRRWRWNVCGRGLPTIC